MILTVDGFRQDAMSNAEYHAHPSVSKSQLDVIRKSPQHYQHMRENPGSREETPAMRLGTAVHAIVLEPHEFETGYVQAPKFDRRTKAGKADAEAFELEHAGKIALDPDDWLTVHAMRDSLMRHPAARALFNGHGVAEASVFWRDETTGVECRCRPDYWRRDIGALVDLKTTEDASPEGFARSMLTYRYHVQHAFYQDGVNAIAATRDDVPPATNFVFVAVEKKAPHAVGVYVLDFDSITLGRIEYLADLARLDECRRTGLYPGYGDRIQNISLPAWHMARNAQHLQIG